MRARPSTWLVLTALSNLALACGSSTTNSNKDAVGASGAGGGAGHASAGHAGSGSQSGAGSSSGGAANAGGGSTIGGAAGGGAAGAGSGGAKQGAGGGAATTTCPATVPPGGTACTFIGSTCFYEDCSGIGRSTAQCAQGKWLTDTKPCAEVACHSTQCASGQMCGIAQGGAFLTMCTQPTCGSGPITCECAHAPCSDCTITGDATQGITLMCNTCPQGGCP